MNYVRNQLYDSKQAILVISLKTIESKECAHFVSFVSVSTGSQFSRLFWEERNYFCKKRCDIAIIMPRTIVQTLPWLHWTPCVQYSLEQFLLCFIFAIFVLSSLKRLYFS